MDPSRPSHLITQTWFEFRRRLGILQRQSPTLPWALVEPVAANEIEFIAKWKSKSPSLPIALLDRAYLAPHLEQYAVAVGHSPEAEAKAIAGGRFRLAPNDFINLGVPPEWSRGQDAFTALHWSRVPARAATSAATEASQFNWVYTLVRAWILSGNETLVEIFWSLLENWLEKNPPNTGPQWVSDEAIARRILAVTFAVQAFRFHPGTTDRRLIQAARLIAVSAERLQPTFGYTAARSTIQGQRSALALFSAGALWPHLSGADIWRSAGLESLLIEGQKLKSPAGMLTPVGLASAVQLLEVYAWVEIILRSENERESLPESLQVKIRGLTESVAQSPATAVPYTPLFSLSGCTSGDARPIIATSLILFMGVRLPAGPWDEEALLIVGPLCLSAVVV